MTSATRSSSSEPPEKEGTPSLNQIDIFSIHEQQAGRLVLDPAYLALFFKTHIEAY